MRNIITGQRGKEKTVEKIENDTRMMQRETRGNEGYYHKVKRERKKQNRENVNGTKMTRERGEISFVTWQKGKEKMTEKYKQDKSDGKTRKNEEYCHLAEQKMNKKYREKQK